MSSSTTEEGRRPALLGWLGVGAAGGALAVALAFLPLDGSAGGVFCLLRRGLDLPCPGCGLTRATAALLRGDFAMAWRLHPLAPVLLIEAVGLWLLIGWRHLRGSAEPLPLAALGGGTGGALVALWLGRVATGTLPW